MRFYDIFWLLFAASLAIGFINSIGIFSTNYMSVPEGATFEIADINGTLQQNVADDASTITMLAGGLAMIKDLVFNMFNVYRAMIDIWHVPPQLAAVLQAVVALTWIIFFIQLFSGRYWGGTES